MNEEQMQRKLLKTKKKVEVLEKMIEDKTRELFLAHEITRGHNRFLQQLYRLLPGALLLLDEQGQILSSNLAAQELLGYDEAQLLELSLQALRDDNYDDLRCFRQEQQWLARDDQRVPVLTSVTRLLQPGANGEAFVCIAQDLRERKQLELELRHAQKLESVGQLSAGIAHEINTPIQFIGDNLYFLREAHQDTCTLLDAYERLRAQVLGQDSLQPILEEIAQIEEDIDLDFLRQNAPASFHASAEGIERITKIVSAMKSFVHTQHEGVTSHQLNDSILTVLTVAQGEYKHSADISLDLDPDLPPVMCYRDDLHQVLLNLIINAAHAINDASTERRGTITIRTRRKGSNAIIMVEDTGTGIPNAIRERIFDPFFTTKEVGRGSGQGLSLAHKIVTDKHGGSLSFTTREGEGSTFMVCLPIRALDAPEEDLHFS